ncbi:MAG: pyridoxal phosphate-dependent aminotransferase [Candidatus Bipolaricaulaceae bacterium]
MPEVSQRSATAPTSPIRRLYPLAREAKRRGKRIYHLNIGQPDIPTPQAFLRGVREAKLDVLAYAPSQGLDGAVEALCGYYADWGIELTPDQLLVTIGGSEAITFALTVTCDPGDQVLVPEPFYPNYHGYAGLTNVEIAPITTSRQDGFHLPPRAEIARLIGPRTKAILFSNPGNPTGVVYGEQELAVLAELALRHNLFLIADEVYREFVYAGQHVSVLTLAGMEQNAILVDSISKRLSACGARIGTFATRNREVMAAATKCAIARLSPPTFGQLGLAAFLADPAHHEVVAEMVAEYRRRRDVVCQALGEIPGLVFRRPEGAFYIMVGLPVPDAEDFVRWMLTDFPGQETVMLAPGAGFYRTPGLGQQEARLAYILNGSDLRRALSILEQGLATYRDTVCAQGIPARS